MLLPLLAASGSLLAAAADSAPDFLRPLLNTLPIVLIVTTAYLLLFRPEREKQRRQQELLAGLKKNDRVVTASGIYGTVANVDREAGRVTLRIDDAAKLTVTLASVAQVLGDKPAEAATG